MLKKNKTSLVASIILVALIFSSIVFVQPTYAATKIKTPVKQVKVVKKPAVKIPKKKNLPIKLKPAPKPTVAEIKAAKQQLAMERNYASYVKGLIKKKPVKSKKKVVKKIVVKKVAKK